ncbi:hypothetical protein MHK_007304, partial [Candidatus Magnetomorum sp. HK-1]
MSQSQPEATRKALLSILGDDPQLFQAIMNIARNSNAISSLAKEDQSFNKIIEVATNNTEKAFDVSEVLNIIHY